MKERRNISQEDLSLLMWQQSTAGTKDLDDAPQYLASFPIGLTQCKLLHFANPTIRTTHDIVSAPLTVHYLVDTNLEIRG